MLIYYPVNQQLYHNCPAAIQLLCLVGKMSVQHHMAFHLLVAS